MGSPHFHYLCTSNFHLLLFTLFNLQCTFSTLFPCPPQALCKNYTILSPVQITPFCEHKCKLNGSKGVAKHGRVKRDFETEANHILVLPAEKRVQTWTLFWSTGRKWVGHAVTQDSQTYKEVRSLYTRRNNGKPKPTAKLLELIPAAKTTPHVTFFQSLRQYPKTANLLNLSWYFLCLSMFVTNKFM